jgi:hypothetical protein
MATLELQFNCLCLFVPDPYNHAVHVLMPATNGQAGHDDHAAQPGHAGHAGSHKHVVRMLHHGFDGDERLKGRSMDGWALTLGSADEPLNSDLVAPAGAPRPAALPNLSDITGNPVRRALLGPNPGPRVAARITLYSGKVSRMASEARWEIDGKGFPIAHQVTWKLEVDPGTELTWERLNGGAQADARPPLAKLKDLEPEDDLGYKLRIFHVTEKALPPRGGTLKPSEMRAHYSTFYPLVGEDYPPDKLLPRITEKHIDRVNCGSGQGSPPPPPG